MKQSRKNSTTAEDIRKPRYLRRCPRCRGLMAVEFDPRVGYLRDCLNCGHVEYLFVCPPVPPEKPVARLHPEGRHVRPAVIYGSRRS